jgi:hypothetical protein
VSRVEFLTSLDLSHAGDITFHSTTPMNRFFAPIPSQLTELALSQVSFAIESLPGGQRYFLPCLTTLTLLDVTFSGPISDYFHCPKLDCVGHFIKSLDVRSNAILVQEIFDVAFYRESLALKTIYLEGLTITDVLIPTLVSCSTLHVLGIKGCYLVGFVHSFLQRLQDPKYLPYLRRLHMEKSWSLQMDLSYREFTAQCRSIRPGLYVFGNE